VTPEEKEEQAKGRFVTLNIIRLVGLGMVLFGIANALGRFLPELSPWLGYVLVAMGMFEFFFLPNIVSKNWRSNDDESQM